MEWLVCLYVGMFAYMYMNICAYVYVYEYVYANVYIRMESCYMLVRRIVL